jgi:protein required for attachment to host cells
MSRIRIIVADQAEAIFYDTASLRARPKEVARISDPLAHQHNRDFSSDRPGRSYESFGSARHAIARENDPRQQEAVRFAKRISRRLDTARRSGEFDELIVVAGPAFREEEIDREREVIGEEIRSGDEDPDSRCATLLFRAVWGDAPMCRPFAGTLESVAGLTRPGLVDFYSRQFHAPHCVAVAAGDIDHEELKAALSGILSTYLGFQECTGPGLVAKENESNE